MDEMRESTRIVAQCLDRLEAMEGEPWIADDRKVVLPPRHELHTSMESLIHHFKIVTEGYRVPEGEIYVPIESPRGEFGCYVVSDGGPKPWRVKFRAPSFVALQATATCMTRRGRRGHDRDRRLARRRHGRGRPVSRRPGARLATLRAPGLPGPCSALFLPARHSEHRVMNGGNVTLADGSRRCGRSTRTGTRPCCPRSGSRRRSTAAGCRPTRCARSRTRSTSRPAYCLSIASFYDMFHLEPVGEHVVEVCTNISCAINGAQQVLEAFEDELGVRAGETSADGSVTLRHDRVRGRVRLADGDRGQPPAAGRRQAGDVAGDRRGAARGDA